MKWSLLIKVFVKRFPQWAAASLIVIVSITFFLGWLMFHGGIGSRSPSKTDVPEKIQFKADSMILCGNTLIDRINGKIVAREWLKGFGASSPPIARVIEEDDLVIVAANNRVVGAFGFDGLQKHAVEVDGKPVVSAAFDGDYRRVVYAREGNLWKGEVDWAEGEVLNPKKFTDTGYFRDDLFRGPWLWHEDELLVSLIGKTLEVDFSGRTKEVHVSVNELQRGMSPDGTFAVVVRGGRDVEVMDLIKGDSQLFPLGQRVRTLLWLGPRKVAMLVGKDSLAVYDHDAGKFDGPQQAQESVHDILGASPDGSCFMMAGTNSIMIFDAAVKNQCRLKIPFEEVSWVSNDLLLCSSNSVETESRGLWLTKKTGELEKISGQPVDYMKSGSFRSVVRTKEGVYFISAGNLWRFDVSDKALKQVTQGEKLQPQLQPFKY